MSSYRTGLYLIYGAVSEQLEHIQVFEKICNMRTMLRKDILPGGLVVKTTALP